MGTLRSPKQAEYARSIVDTNIDAIKNRIDSELAKNHGDLQAALGVGRRTAMMLPMDYPDHQFLHAFGRLYPEELQQIIATSLRRIPQKYRQSIMNEFMIEKPAPAVHEHERGTPELQYRC